LVEVGYSKSGLPKITAVDGAAVDWADLISRTADALTSERRWFTFPMFGYFRTVGAYSSDGLRLRPIDDLNAVPTGLPWIDDLANVPSQPPLNAYAVDVAYMRPRGGFIQFHRQQAAMTMTSHLLSVATWPRTWRYSASRMEWMTFQDPATGATRNTRVTPGFHLEDGGDKAEPPSLGGLAPIERVEHGRLAAGPLDLNDGSLRIADTMERLHSALQSLTLEEGRKARRALAWMADAADAPNLSMKISSYVAGIESLLPDSEATRCKECRQPVYGLTARVRDLLSEFAGQAMRSEYLDLVYGTRSQVVHGGWHYPVDAPMFSFESSNALKDELIVAGAARAVMLNWLLARDQS
jgi:hypothetical protein